MSSGVDQSLVFIDDLKVNKMYRKYGKYLGSEKEIDSGGLFLCNPRIIARSPEVDMNVWTEECLVLPPTFTATVLRDSTILVEYEDVDNGKTKSKSFNGELARALQHEMDHDRGILIVDHVELDELESVEMKDIEEKGHEDRMRLAYSRYIDVHTTRQNTFQLVKNPFVEVANAMEPNEAKPTNNESPTTLTQQSQCDEECISQRKKIIEERRAMMKQSKSNTNRRDVLELSNQRANLYNTKYGGL